MIVLDLEGKKTPARFATVAVNRRGELHFSVPDTCDKCSSGRHRSRA